MRPFLQFSKTVLCRLRQKQDKMRTQCICLALAIVLNCPVTSAQWVQSGLAGRSIGDIAVGSSGLFAVTSDSGSLYRSTDGGANWFQIVQSGARDVAVAPNGTIFMVKEMYYDPDYRDLFRSSDGGTTWLNQRMDECITGFGGAPYDFSLNVAVGPAGTVFCGAECNPWIGEGSTAFASSTDNGLSWISHGIDTVHRISDTLGGAAFAFSGHYVITVGSHSGDISGWIKGCLYLSSDDGQSWIFKGDTPKHADGPLALRPNGNILCGWWSGGYSNPWGWQGLALSSDSGVSWTAVSSVHPSAILSLPSGGVLVAANGEPPPGVPTPSPRGIFLFSDYGDSLGPRNEGLTNLNVKTLAMDAIGYVYAGTDSGIYSGIWRRPLSELVSVKLASSEFPSEFTLSQNYPNPFNPRTKIQFTIVNRLLTIAKVYDLLGREVATLANEVRSPGTYTVEFDGSGLASGVYFYRLQAGSFVQTKKMLVAK
jgi:hypothetical protein